MPFSVLIKQWKWIFKIRILIWKQKYLGLLNLVILLIRLRGCESCELLSWQVFWYTSNEMSFKSLIVYAACGASAHFTKKYDNKEDSTYEIAYYSYHKYCSNLLIVFY